MAAAAESPLEVESAVLVYSEPQRVTAVEAVAEAFKAFQNDRTLRIKLIYDALSGASANGATPARTVQTFTSPSGNSTYATQPGDTPLDSTFRDARYATSIGYAQPLGRLSRLNLGFHGSTETDYLSLGASAGITRDVNRRNTTLSAGVSLSRDSVSPQGGTPVPFTPMRPPGDGREDEDDGLEGGSESKQVYDGVIGLTQVVTRTTLARLNYSISHTSGYTNDPYKLLSVVGAPGSEQAGDPLEYLYENRPDRHTKQSLFTEVRQRIGEHTADLSYRYLWDDWGITSHTLELRWRQHLDDRHYLQPHVRWYRQGQADFFRRYLVDGDPLPDHATADYRLGDLDALTLGLGFGRRLSDGQIFKISAEYYKQYSGRGPPGTFGALEGSDLYPDVSAVMVRLGYGRSF
jgi:hypothetical protein